jgi:hypothetical protein
VPLTQWRHLEHSTDKAMNISSERTCALLRILLAWPVSRLVILAVIDSKGDIAHVDLKRVQWHQPWRVAANGLDNDHIDNVYDWNFMGGAGGCNLFYNIKSKPTSTPVATLLKACGAALLDIGPTSTSRSSLRRRPAPPSARTSTSCPHASAPVSTSFRARCCIRMSAWPASTRRRWSK